MANRVEYDASLKSLVIHDAVQIKGQSYDLTIRLRSSGVVLNQMAYNEYLKDDFLEALQIDRINEIAQNCFESIRKGYNSEIKDITQVAVQIQDIGHNNIRSRAIIAKDGLSGFDVLKNNREQDIKLILEDDEFDSGELQDIYDELGCFDGMGIKGLSDVEPEENAVVVDKEEKTPEIDPQPVVIPLHTYPGDYQKKWLKNKYNEWKKNSEDWLYNQRPWFGRSVWDNIDFDTKDPYRPETFTESERDQIRQAINGPDQGNNGFSLFFDGLTEEDVKELLAGDAGLAAGLGNLSAREVINTCFVRPLLDQWVST